MKNPTILWQRAVTFTVIKHRPPTPNPTPRPLPPLSPRSPHTVTQHVLRKTGSSATIITCSPTGCSLGLWSMYDGMWWWEGGVGEGRGGEHVGVGGCKTSLWEEGRGRRWTAPLPLSLSLVCVSKLLLSRPPAGTVYFSELYNPTPPPSSSSFLSSHFSNLSPPPPLPPSPLS